MAVTELNSTLVAAQTDIPYGTIDLFPGTTLTDESVLVLTIDGVLKTLTTDYTVNTSSENIVLVTPAVGGEMASVSRVTRVDALYIDFENNTTIDADDLDLGFKQLLYLIQETVTTIGDFLEYSPVNAYWDGQLRRTANFLPATISSGLTTLGQVQDILAGVSTASIDLTTDWTFTPSTPTTVFNLTGAPQGLASGTELFVWINGVHQRSGVGYTLSTAGAVPTLTTESLTSGDTMYVVAISGSVSTTFADGSIDSDAIANNAIGIQHVQMDSGDASRVWLFTAGGNPVERRLELDDIKDFVVDLGNAASDNSIEFNDLAVPTVALDLNGQKVTNSATGTASTDLVTLAQVQALISAINTPSLYSDILTVPGSSSVTVDIGFVPEVILVSTDAATVKSWKLDASNPLSIASVYTVSLSGTEITVAKSSAGDFTSFALTAFG